MEITNKNKEEIEKIRKKMNWMFDSGIDYNYGKKLEIKLEERIKTSILWCEDEIEFLEDLFYKQKKMVFYSEFVRPKVKQLQTHLTWLKEQEKE